MKEGGAYGGRLEAQWRSPDAYPFMTEVPLRWSDLDMFQHVNNVKIALLYEEVRVRLMEAIEAGLPQPFERIRRVVADVRIQYLGEVFYPAPVRVGGRVAAVGSSSYRLSMAMFQNDICVGACDTVFVHFDGGRSLPLPDAWRRSLAVLARCDEPAAALA